MDFFLSCCMVPYSNEPTVTLKKIRTISRKHSARWVVQGLPRSSLGDVSGMRALSIFWNDRNEASSWQYLVGAFEPWNFMTFHSVGNIWECHHPN